MASLSLFRAIYAGHTTTTGGGITKIKFELFRGFSGPTY